MPFTRKYRSFPLLASALAALLLPGCIRKSIYPGSRISRARVSATLEPEGWTMESISAGGETLLGVERAPHASGARWIVFFGGNGSSIVMNAHAAATIAAGSDVGLATFAYRGYDGSTGTPSEPALERDAQAVAAHLFEAHGVTPDRLVLVGHSLGSGVAASLDEALSLAGTPPARLLLVSPFLSIARVVDDLVPCGGCLVRDRWPTSKRVASLSAPILIVHGDQDEVIGVHQGRDLAKLLGAKATLVVVPGRHHNDIFADPDAVKAMHAFAVPER